MLRKRMLCLALLLVCGSCSPSLKGKFVGENYYDAKGWFSVEVSKSCLYETQEQTTETSSSVAFLSDMGGLLRFEVFRIPDDFIEKMHHLLECDPDLLKQSIFTPYLNDVSFQFPGAEIMYEEVARNGNENEIFILMNIPHGGTLVDLSTGKRTDALRGYLLFLSGDQLIIESFQFKTSLVERQGEVFFKNALGVMQEKRRGYKNLCTP